VDKCCGKLFLGLENQGLNILHGRVHIPVQVKINRDIGVALGAGGLHVDDALCAQNRLLDGSATSDSTTSGRRWEGDGHVDHGKFTSGRLETPIRMKQMNPKMMKAAMSIQANTGFRMEMSDKVISKPLFCF